MCTCVSAGMSLAPLMIYHPYVQQAAYITAGTTPVDGETERESNRQLCVSQSLKLECVDPRAQALRLRCRSCR